MQVALDTNVLLMPFTDGLPLIEELERVLGAVEPVVPSAVITELTTLSQGDGAAARAAAGALRWITGWPVIETSLPGDDGVLEVARGCGALCSNDKAVLQEARKAGVVAVGRRGPRLAKL